METHSVDPEEARRILDEDRRALDQRIRTKLNRDWWLSPASDFLREEMLLRRRTRFDRFFMPFGVNSVEELEAFEG